MAELADALDSGSNGRKAVQVQVLSPAPSLNRLNLFTVGKMFGLFRFFRRVEDFQAIKEKQQPQAKISPAAVIGLPGHISISAETEFLSKFAETSFCAFHSS